MIALMRAKAAITGTVIFLFTLTAAPLGAAVSVEKSDIWSSKLIETRTSNQESTDLLSDALIFAAVPSTSETEIEPEKKTTYQINSLKWEQTAEDIILRIQGDNPPTYTMYELFDPLRVIIDIADASMGSTVNLPLEQPQGPVSLVNGKVLEDKEPFIARLEIFLNEDNSYTVERIDNDILIRFPKATSDRPAQEDIAAVIQSDKNEAIPTATNTDEISPEVTETPEDTTNSGDEVASLAKMAEDINPAILEETITASTEVIAPAAPTKEEPETQTDHASVLFDVEVSHTPTETLIYLKGDGEIRDFKEVRLGKNMKANRPDRIYLDVDNVKLAGPIETKMIGTAVSQVRTAQRKNGFRVVFDSSLDTLFDYSVSVQSDGLLVTVQEPSPATAIIAGIMKDSGQLEEPTIAPQPEIIPTEDSLEQASEPVQPQLASIVETAPKSSGKTNKSTKTTIPKAAEDFTFAGYQKQRITVDFYKIDLHNVFRLFGEVSNLNMVVDEGVAGSLTLALNDVPWDFALDIILNLKDLQKEERFNTIVISPKSKKFAWPERTLESIEFKANIEILEVENQKQEALKISKRQEIPETVVEAKKLVHQAQLKEKNGDYNAALLLYEDAFKKWPDNIVLAKRIAGLCLVNLSHNSKAVNYAKAALQINPNDNDAALQAAIGLARMMKNDLAKNYFDLSVSGDNPSSESLSSYSGFCEENQDLDCALSMLQKHDDLYGDTLDTMISRARILDKQGKMSDAADQYRALLLSGYEIPPDLTRFIKARVNLAGN